MLSANQKRDSELNVIIAVIKHCSLVHDCPTQVTKLATFSVLSMNFMEFMEFMEYSIGCFLLPEL